MPNQLNILALEPFHGGSHRAFLEGLRRASSHRIELLTMRPRHWKWRMRGAIFPLAREIGTRPETADLVLASDFVDLAAVVALLPERWRRVPRAIYFHENQLTYPVPPGEKLDFHFGLTNVVSALAAQRLFFNSRYHLEEFFRELPRFLGMFPDARPRWVVEALRPRAEHLPLGCDLARLDAFRPRPPERGRAPAGARTVLWNHRWEFDKNPEDFFGALFEVKERGVPFRLVVAGERAGRWPAVFDEAERRLAAEIVSWGTLRPDRAYARALWSADVVVSTAIHEFFGTAMVEAIYCGAYPLLPDRLAYPELIPPQLADRHLYHRRENLVRRLCDVLADPVLETDSALAARAAEFDWSVLAPRYDEALARVAAMPAE